MCATSVAPCFFILPPTIRIVLATKIPVRQMILSVIRLSISAGLSSFWASSIRYSRAACRYLLAGARNPVDRIPLALVVGNVPNGAQWGSFRSLAYAMNTYPYTRSSFALLLILGE